MKQQINNLQDINNTLGNREDFSRLIMNNIPQAIFWVDEHLNIMGANKHFHNIYRLKEGEEIGKKVHVFTIDINEKDETISIIKEVLRSKKAVYNHHQHFEIKRKTKQLLLWVRQNYIPLLNDFNEIIGVLVTTVDISKEKIDEAQMETYNRQLVRSNKELEQFAYIASHDLRSPLTNIISFITLLKKSIATKLNEEERVLMNFIASGAQDMEERVNAILEFSKINDGAIKLQVFSISALLETLQKEMKVTLLNKNAHIVIQEIPNTIVGDQLQIKQLLKNLITNSIKFIKKDTHPIIVISCIEDTNYWRFKIVDNGIGIEEEHHDKIFKLFQRLHPSSDYEGTGIGLPLCKKIVVLHGGEIWVESEIGKGSTFFFTIKKPASVTKREKMLRNFF